MRSFRGARVMVALLLVVGMLSLLAMSQSTHTIIVGDPAVYRERVQAILNGGLPYLDVPLEHLPAMLVPMFLAWILGGAGSQSDFVFVYSLLQLVALATTLVAVVRLGASLGLPSAGARWMVATLPLIPLVIFRNDPFVTLLFVLGALALSSARGTWVLWGVTGALAKVWPSVLGLWGFKKNRRSGAAVVVLSGVLALVWTVLPGFVSARQAQGIHAETAVGAIVGLVRVLLGNESEVEITTAAYLPAELWVVLLNAAIGVALVSLGVVALVRSDHDRLGLLALGSVTAGVILSSPLFSLQYLLWMTPFVAVSKARRTLVIGVMAAILTTALAWYWDPSLFEQPLFYTFLSVRNAMLVTLAVWLAVEALGGRPTASQAEGSEAVPA